MAARPVRAELGVRSESKRKVKCECVCHENWGGAAHVGNRCKCNGGNGFQRGLGSLVSSAIDRAKKLEESLNFVGKSVDTKEVMQ